MPAKKVIDVTEAGQSAPSSSSRPIIVTHGSRIEDPMMAKPAIKTEVTKDTAPAAEQSTDDESPSQRTAASTSTLSSTGRVKITPLSESAVADPPSAGSPEKKPEEPPVSDAAVVDAVLEQAGPLKQGKADDKAATDEAEKNKAIEQAIADKKYFVTIRESRAARRFEHRLILFLVLLLLALIAFNFALDAELLDANIRPITDLIQN